MAIVARSVLLHDFYLHVKILSTEFQLLLLEWSLEMKPYSITPVMGRWFVIRMAMKLVDSTRAFAPLITTYPHRLEVE
jgi:hypothetical protein